ncbi:hypothetical protein GQ53DRAFT_887419 [Thozetella sp. PMI_491]|nr:hypothetical protein GQ53DRAFT_887419 [Thozetella sp. PMI_491]
MHGATWLLAATAVAAAPREIQSRATGIDTSTLKGKWLYGYQGWFRKPGPGINSHWAPGGTPGPGNVEIEFFPDVSEYPANCLFDTGFLLPGGATGQLYDNTCDGVVDLHFSWMKTYGVDGVLVQRFLSAVNDASFITIVNQVQAAAEKHGLGFLVEYDVSSGNSSKASVANAVLADYNSKIKPFTASPAYIHQDGKPVIMTFGIGYPERPINGTDSLNLINQMKAAGVYYGIGVPSNWAITANSTSELAPALKAADLVSPWTVGSYSNGGYLNGYYKNEISDAQFLKNLGIGYAPVIWPGTSSDHLDGGNAPSRLDNFPRFNGSFYQMQANSVMDLNPTFMYSAMFDEVNEGTGSYAVLKNNQLPTNEVFVGINNDFSSTNHYLELGGQLASVFHSRNGA